jgi:hypothetical protein
MDQVPTINTTFAFNTYNTEVEGICILQGQGPYYHFNYIDKRLILLFD